MIYVNEQDKPFGGNLEDYTSDTLEEKVGFADVLEEMASLKKDVSGLPVNIWVDDSGSYIRGRHAMRIKFQGDYGNKTNPNNLFSMLLSKDNPEIPKNQIAKVKLPMKDINAIKTFVIDNADPLSQLADEKIGIDVFLKRMKKYSGKSKFSEYSFEDSDVFEGMSGLKVSDGILPVNIWLDDTRDYLRGNYVKRILFQGNNDDLSDRSNLFSMTISKDNPHIPEVQLPRLTLPVKDIQKIKDFVMKNADLLSKLADEKITFTMFIKQMKL